MGEIKRTGRVLVRTMAWMENAVAVSDLRPAIGPNGRRRDLAASARLRLLRQ